MGIPTDGFLGDLPLILAFVILAAFTYTSGLRAPASIAIVKDVLIYATIIVALIVIPTQLGGFGKIFSAIPASKLLLPHPPANSWGQYSAYATLAFGSALALFLYPHSITGVLSSNSRDVIKRNAAFLPAYSFLLGLIALLGYMAIAAGVDKLPEFAGGFKQYGSSFTVPALFLHAFPSWFAGFAFAAIGIGALVPAAIMSIATANLFTRNIYKEYFRPDCTAKEEATTAKVVSLVVKLGALAFVIFLPLQYAIQLQLLGGVWMSQTLPAVLISLYTRWFHRTALLWGWIAGIVSGTWMASMLQFKSSIYPLALDGLTIPGYAAFYALILNIAVSVVLTWVFNAMRVSRGGDATEAHHYHV
jgi:SSS family solute:Na+ symporter